MKLKICGILSLISAIVLTPLFARVIEITPNVLTKTGAVCCIISCIIMAIFCFTESNAKGSEGDGIL